MPMITRNRSNPEDRARELRSLIELLCCRDRDQGELLSKLLEFGYTLSEVAAAFAILSASGRIIIRGGDGPDPK